MKANAAVGGAAKDISDATVNLGDYWARSVTQYAEFTDRSPVPDRSASGSLTGIDASDHSPFGASFPSMPYISSRRLIIGPAC
jgi:hypothetical protein